MEKNKHIESWKVQTEYCGEYTDDNGQKWAVNIFAADDADAVARMGCVRKSFTILGRLEAVIEAK